VTRLEPDKVMPRLIVWRFVEALEIVPLLSVTFEPESVKALAPEAKLRFERLRLETVLVFVVPSDPPKTSVLVEPVGAVPEAQFPVVLQFVLLPLPTQLYVPAAEAAVASKPKARIAASGILIICQRHRPA